MDCSHLEDLYELYVLGILSGREREDVRSHVSEKCPRCLEALREAAETVCWLAQSSAPVRPRPALRARLLRRLASHDAQPAGPGKSHHLIEPGAASRPKA